MRREVWLWQLYPEMSSALTIYVLVKDLTPVMYVLWRNSCWNTIGAALRYHSCLRLIWTVMGSVIKRYRCEGDLYKRIIENYYLNSESISNEEMARAENLSTASIERKKREAIKYLGISMYIYACCREQEERDQYDRARWALELLFCIYMWDSSSFLYGKKAFDGLLMVIWWF